MVRTVGRFYEPRSTISVLHVDDDPGFADLTAEFLEREDDIEVVTETDPVAARQRFEETDIDCIVSDYEMPELDGIELLRAIREVCPDVPFVLLTGKGSEEIASEAVSAGVTDYIQKGGGSETFDLLATRIRNAVDRYRAIRAMEDALRAIDTAREGIAIVDEEGRFVYLNATYANIYGCERDELLGEHWRALYQAEDAEDIERQVLPEVAEHGVWRGVTVGKRPDGTTFRKDHSLAETDSGGLVCVIRPLEEGTDGDVVPVTPWV